MTKEERKEARLKLAAEIRSGIGQFTGSQKFTRHLCGTILTEGAVWLADSAQAWWMMDMVASYQTEAKVKREQMQVYKFTINLESGQAEVEISDGNKKVLATQKFTTDFPLASITLWACENELGGHTVMLPSEY
jgi:hypothetical protein